MLLYSKTLKFMQHRNWPHKAFFSRLLGLKKNLFSSICFHNVLFLLMADFPKFSQLFLMKNRSSAEDQVKLHEKHQVSLERLSA